MHADAHSHSKHLPPSGKDSIWGTSGLNRLREWERSAGLELPGSASTRGRWGECKHKWGEAGEGREPLGLVS